MSLSPAGFDLSLLNFSANCDISGRYFATPKEDVTLTVEFFREALPTEYRDNFTSPDIEKYIILPAKDSKLIDEAERRAKGDCWVETCSWAYRDFRGNPDITGIGMLVSYAIQCFLFTVFSLANFIYRGARTKASPEAWWPERITTDAMRFWGFLDPETLRIPMKMVREAQLVFLDSSILFALSVSVAAFASQKRQETVYDVAFTCFVSGYVVMPLIPCLHDLWESKVYRRPMRVMFTIMAFILGVSGGVLMVWKDANMRFADTDCPIVEFASFRMVFTGSMVVFVGVIKFVLHFIEMPTWLDGLRGRFPLTNSVVTSILMILSVALSACCWGLYLMFLIFTWKDRTEVGRVVGQNFEDARMGFGQVVALWLWVPALTEFFTLWYYGMEGGLSGRVLGGGKYVVTEEAEDREGSAGRSRPGSYLTVEDGMQEMLRRRYKPYGADEEE